MSLLLRLISFVTSAKSAQTSLRNVQGSAKKVHETVRAVQAARSDRMQLKLERGDAAAQYDLGERYYESQGVPRDYAEAFKWFHKAALQGHVKAQSNVGMMYFIGRGVARNYVEAYKWICLAAAQGNENAAKAKTRALQRMSAEEIAEGKQLADQFIPSKATNED